MKSESAFPLLFVGIKNAVVALDKRTGSIVWSTKLKRMSSLVTVLHESAFVFATADGEAWCLQSADGKVVWHQKLEGYGSSWTTISGAGTSNSAGAVAEATAAAVDAATAASTAN